MEDVPLACDAVARTKVVDWYARCSLCFSLGPASRCREASLPPLRPACSLTPCPSLLFTLISPPRSLSFSHSHCFGTSVKGLLASSSHQHTFLYGESFVRFSLSSLAFGSSTVQACVRGRRRVRSLLSLAQHICGGVPIIVRPTRITLSNF